MKEIKIKDIPTYSQIPEYKWEKSWISRDAAVSFPDAMKESLAEEVEKFLCFRSAILSIVSMKCEIGNLKVIIRFLNDECPSLCHLSDMPLDELTRRLKKWMLKNGYKLFYGKTEAKRDGEGKNGSDNIRSPLFGLLDSMYRYLSPPLIETQKDIWVISRLPFPVKTNQTASLKSLNFSKIHQETIKEEIKEAGEMELRYLAAASFNEQLYAVVRFCGFLRERFPKITSLKELNRDIIEEYLIFLNTEVAGKKSFRSELSSLKSLLDSCALCMDCPSLRNLFYRGDITDRGKLAGYIAYSDAEMRMWNSAFKKMDAQVGRALLIQAMMGNRISETLILAQDCIEKDTGSLKVKVYMQKTGKTVYKNVSGTVISLIESSISYTNERFGKRRYVFVDSNDPDAPMSYRKVRGELEKTIEKEELRDENGELFRPLTHAFRHTMAQRLTQMHIDDEIIARMLGHANTQTLDRYRRFSADALAKETEKTRKAQDEVIKDIIAGWEDE